MNPIIQEDGAGRPCILVDAHGEPVKQGQTVVHRDGTYTVTGGRAPKQPGSTGRVWVERGDEFGEYFPSVFGMSWTVIQPGFVI